MFDQDKHELAPMDIEQTLSLSRQRYVLLRHESGKRCRCPEMFRRSKRNTLTLKWILRISGAIFLIWFLLSSSGLSAVVLRIKGLKATISDQNKPHRDKHMFQGAASTKILPIRIISGDLNHVADAEDRKQYVKQMMMHAWDGYKKHAWGFQELDPVHHKPRHGALFDTSGSVELGLTIVDGLSTLKLMQLDDRFRDGRNWVRDSFKPDVYPQSASVFEWNIRYVGGLLSAYALTKDDMFKKKAIEAADYLLPAFESQTGIPYSTVFKNGGRSNGHAVLSEMGTLHLEFEYLSFITGNDTYARKVYKLREVLRNKPKTAGLYPSIISPDSPNAEIMGGKISFGAMCDSFYEYLLKTWLMSNKKDSVAKQMYVDAVKAMETRGVIVKAKDANVLLGELRLPSLGFVPIMDHFACFAGGMFALQATAMETTKAQKDHWMTYGKGVAKGCHEGYAKSGTNLGPDRITFHGNKVVSGGGYYQRPEAIETWFILWRTTKDPVYREWAWDFVKAIERHTKTDSGYTGLNDVNNADTKDGTMQSFFLGETLKYLYLIFCDDSVVPLDQWVFNTEAHPLPVHDPVTLSS